MKNLFIFLLALSLSALAACKHLVLHMEGIKQPQLEDHLSLSRFLNANGIDTSEILCFKDMDALEDFYKTGIGIPDARFFNRDKKLVNGLAPYKSD